jgi:hypothetical protein
MTKENRLFSNLSSLGNVVPALRDSKIVFSSKANKYSGIFALFLLFKYFYIQEKLILFGSRETGAP